MSESNVIPFPQTCWSCHQNPVSDTLDTLHYGHICDECASEGEVSEMVAFKIPRLKRHRFNQRLVGMVQEESELSGVTIRLHKVEKALFEATHYYQLQGHPNSLRLVMSRMVQMARHFV